MTHKDIYTKFMIEYDKANITSSYPSLTRYEIATILDKAYLALIGQKVTGNNPRRIGFEADIKSIEDVRQLEINQLLKQSSDTNLVSNEVVFDIPQDFLYYITSLVTMKKYVPALDHTLHNSVHTQLLNHDLAQKFKNSDTNMPWIKQPITYLENNKIHMLFDSYKYEKEDVDSLCLVYIKSPAKFVDDTDKNSQVKFELNDSIAEELINLAIAFATEIVESPRLQTKLSTLQFES